MTVLGQHASYILGAYGFTALVIGVLIWRSLSDHRAQKRALRAFEGGAGEQA